MIEGLINKEAKKTEKLIVFENPGSVRTGTGQMLKGGISDPRNTQATPKL